MANAWEGGMRTVVSRKLFEFALLDPLQNQKKPDTLKIVSGYATPAMAVAHLMSVRRLSRKLRYALPLNIDLVYGMAGESGVSEVYDSGFKALREKREFKFNGSFDCSYVKAPLSVHSKVYVWCKGDKPIRAFMGSANYSERAFKSPTRIETLTECDPLSALTFFEEAKSKAIDCENVDVRKDFKRTKKQQLVNCKSAKFSIEDDESSEYYLCPKLEVSLLTKTGKTGNGSRLNWGVRPSGKPRKSGRSRRNPNQSYIGLPSNVYRSDFFPPKAERFTVLTDDNVVMTCVRAQDHGKAIETKDDNSELGLYFRKRLGLQSGAYVRLSDLKKYGRTNVVFWKLGDANYVMDFSRQIKH
ncbi:MAG: NgoFVII family restriction endonuclease [Kiritimatiellae bacterium]|nr:NgoFVII family restriction endonuclease [Kiritimatiellia bacterium]